MPDGSIPLFISIIVLIGFSAFFSATETAYTCASRIKLKSLFLKIPALSTTGPVRRGTSSEKRESAEEIKKMKKNFFFDSVFIKIFHTLK